jgi:hypothetical protein
MKKLFILSVLAAASLNLLFFTTASGQDPSPSPTPEPSPTPPELLDSEPSAVVSVGEQEPQTMHSRKGQFPVVQLQPGDTASVQLRFPPGLAGTTLLLEALDGGTVSTDNIVIDSDGTASVQFQVPADAGVYRLMVNASGQLTLLQFGVPQQ